MYNSSVRQFEMVSLELLVPADHQYRRFLSLLNFKHLTTDLRKKESDLGADGYGIECLFKCLLLQFAEDLSDRELEKFLQENTAGKYFCGFSLTARTPDYSLFSRVRERIGTSRLSKLFVKVRNSLKKANLISEVFNFVDSSHLISKNNLWKEKDKSIQAKYEKLNNETLPKIAIDKEASIGSKGKNKFWYGFKKHISVDMQSGLINKVSITSANLPDYKGLEFVCPRNGVVYADKGYCMSDADFIIRKNMCENRSIKRNNMKEKDFGLDSWNSKIRSPYERVFSKSSHRARYRGKVKNQFTAFMEGLAFNLKRLIILDVPPLSLA